MGSYNAELSSFTAEYEKLQMRNFFFYSIFKASPVLLKSAVYDKGTYYSSSENTGIEQNFLNSYSVMLHLNDLTEITDEDTDTMLCMTNKLTHEDTLLQMPDFELSLHVDNDAYYDDSIYEIDGIKCNMGYRGNGAPTGPKFKHFCVNVKSYIELGKWFDYMRENGVYDNTRIILVSDHGQKLKQFDNLVYKGLADMQQFNCLLMVKDFNATGFTRSDEFMTNADTPVIAMESLIDDPVNPFTGNPITDDEKRAHPQLVTTSTNWRVDNLDDATQLLSKKETWLSVQDNIFDSENWTVIGHGWDDVMHYLEDQPQ